MVVDAAKHMQSLLIKERIIKLLASQSDFYFISNNTMYPQYITRTFFGLCAPRFIINYHRQEVLFLLMVIQLGLVHIKAWILYITQTQIITPIECIM